MAGRSFLTDESSSAPSWKYLGTHQWEPSYAVLWLLPGGVEFADWETVPRCACEVYNLRWLSFFAWRLPLKSGCLLLLCARTLGDLAAGWEDNELHGQRAKEQGNSGDES